MEWGAGEAEAGGGVERGVEDVEQTVRNGRCGICGETDSFLKARRACGAWSNWIELGFSHVTRMARLEKSWALPLRMHVCGSEWVS